MYKKAFFLFLITLIVYGFSSRGEGAHFNYFVILAEAFLHGKLNVLEHPNSLNELVQWGGKYYVVYPPMPAILLMPFVKIFGISFYQPYLSIFLGGVNVSIAFLVFNKLFQNEKLSWWMSSLYAFGTIQWFHAEVGSAWYVAQIVALFFLWLSLWEMVTKKRFFLIGLFIGASYLARLPTILSIVFVIFYLKAELSKKNLIMLFLGVLPGLVLDALYNFIRFGRLDDYAYSIYLKAQSAAILHSVFPFGFFSIYYIPDRIKDIFWSFPVFINKAPFIIPSLYSMALWVVTPAFLLILFSSFKKRLIYSSLVTILVISLTSLTKGGNGFTQFGFRYSLDFLPFLLILTASGLKNKFNSFSKFLIILSILINLWGVIMVSFLNIWTI